MNLNNGKLDLGDENLSSEIFMQNICKIILTPNINVHDNGNDDVISGDWTNHGKNRVGCHNILLSFKYISDVIGRRVKRRNIERYEVSEVDEYSEYVASGEDKPFDFYKLHGNLYFNLTDNNKDDFVIYEYTEDVDTIEDDDTRLIVTDDMLLFDKYKHDRKIIFVANIRRNINI